VRAIAVAIVLCAGAARADDAPPDLVASIAKTLEAHHSGDAYPQLLDAVARYPTDARVRYLAALCAFRLARRDEAREHLDAGLRAHPDDADLLGLSSMLGFVEGDVVTARSEAEYALTLSPSQSDAQTTMADLDWSARASDRSNAAEFPPGSPRWFVDRVMARLYGGAEAPELSGYLAVDLLRGLPAEQRTRGMLLDFARVFRRDWLVARERTKVDPYGWAVGDVASEDDGRVWVDVHLSVGSRVTQEETDDLARMYADPTLRPQMSTALQEQLGEVDDADRPALLARMKGQHSISIDLLRVELVPTGSAYQVSDVVYNGVDYAQLIPSLPDTQEALARRTSETSSAIWIAAGAFVIVMLGVGVGLVLSALRAPARVRRRR
jgi:hypothetical protein